MESKMMSKSTGHNLGIKKGMIGMLLLAMSLPLWAASVVTDMAYQSDDSGRVDLVVTFAEEVPAIEAFQTTEPPAIVLDMMDTSLALSEKNLTVGNGATSAIVASESGEKARLMVELYRPAAYEQFVEGNKLHLKIAGGAGATANAGNASMFANPADPAEQAYNNVSVSKVDFKRTETGAGEIIIEFSGAGAVAEMKTEGRHVFVEIPGVSLAPGQSQVLDVVDFATPVQQIDVNKNASGSVLDISTSGAFESLSYQTGNQYIIEITPVSQEVAQQQDASKTLGEGKKKAYTGEPVTFNFQDIPVRTVLQLIAEHSGMNIVAADTVGGSVTLRLNNVPWDQVLDIVMQSKGLDKRQEGSVIWVAPQSEISAYEKAKAEATLALQQSEPLVTEYIPVNYSSAGDIVALMTRDAEKNQAGGGAGANQSQQMDTSGFLSARGSVTADDRTNTIILNDIPSKIDEIKDLIKLMDRPVDQVMIEARIVIANEDFAKDIGARLGLPGENFRGNGSPNNPYYPEYITHGTLQSVWNARNSWAQDGRIEYLTGDGGGYNVNLPATPVNGQAGSIALSLLTGNYLVNLELSALQVEGRGEIVANPRVITSNQQPAVIKQGDEIGYVVIQESSGARTATVQFKEVVLELNVTPTITQDDRVFLKMNIKKDDLDGYVEALSYRIPQISKREITTQVLVEDGQTVVLGGVYEFQSREDLKKVPFLGDLPALGRLFKSKSNQKSKAELLIFVTPQILRLGSKMQ